MRRWCVHSSAEQSVPAATADAIFTACATALAASNSTCDPSEPAVDSAVASASRASQWLLATTAASLTRGAAHAAAAARCT